MPPLLFPSDVASVTAQPPQGQPQFLVYIRDGQLLVTNVMDGSKAAPRNTPLWVGLRYVRISEFCYNGSMAEVKQIRVLIADDFKALRDVIRLYLGRTTTIIVIGESPELHDALEQAKTLQPDVIIMNDYLPPVDSALAAALFRQEGISAAILAISMGVEPGLMRRSLEYGVNGFMNKDEINIHLVEAVHRISKGERYLSPKAQEAYDGIQE